MELEKVVMTFNKQTVKMISRNELFMFWGIHILFVYLLYGLYTR